MKKKSVWKISALSGALLMAASFVVKYNSMKGEREISAESEEECHRYRKEVYNA